MTKKKKRRFRKLQYWLIHHLGAPLIAIIMHIVRLTLRIEFNQQEHRDLKEKYGNIIYAFWHENLILICIAAWLVRGDIYVMVSPSNDGEIVARVGSWFRLKFVRGSSFKNPKAALKKIISLVKSDANAAIAVDGPRGPRHETQKGIFLISRLGHTPIIPVRLECSNCWTIKSWDRTRIPKPFSKLKAILGQPIKSWEKNSDTEQQLSQLENFLNDKV